MFGAHVRQEPQFVGLQRGAEARARQHAGIGADPLESPVEEEKSVARLGTEESGDGPLRAPPRHGQHRRRIGRKVDVLSF